MILCEGKTDAILLSYYLGKKKGWKYISRGPSGAHIGADISEKEVVWYNYFLSFFDSLEYNVIKSKVKSFFCGGEIVNMVSLAGRATAVSLATDQCCSGKCEKIIDRANLITGLDLSHETVEKLISLSKIRNDIVHETKMSICSDEDVSRYELVVYGTVERMGKHLIEVGAKVEDNGYFNWFD